MSERVREVAVTVEVETTQSTRHKRLVRGEDEYLDDFMRRIDETIAKLTEVS